MSVKTWYDAEGNWIAKATVRPCTEDEIAEFNNTWCETTSGDGWWVERPRDHAIGGGPFDTHAEAMELSDRLNGGHRVNGLFVLDVTP